MPTLSPRSESLPLLPQAPINRPWSADIINAHNELHASFDSAQRALNLDESDPIHLRYHLNQASGFMVDMVDALGLREMDPLPSSHLNSLAIAVGSLVVRLRGTLADACARYISIFFSAFALIDE
jgi:hypothetical protein